MEHTSTNVIDCKKVTLDSTFKEHRNNVIDILLKYFNENSKEEE